MKFVVESVKVPEKKKDVEAARTHHRKPSCLLVNAVPIALLVVAGVIGYLIGAFYMWTLMDYKRSPSAETTVPSSVHTSTIRPDVAEQLPSHTATPIRPVIDPTASKLLDWPEAFRRNGSIKVYDGLSDQKLYPDDWSCNLSQYNVILNCLLGCYRILGYAARVFTPGLSIQTIPTSQHGCFEETFPANNGTRNSGLNLILEEQQPPMPMSQHLRNFTVWSDTKLVPIKTPKPTVSIKMPLVNMSYSDHTKLCLSFCAIHPDCLACSMLPEEPLRVDHGLDRVVALVGYKLEGTLSCLLFLKDGVEDFSMDTVQSNGTVSYITTEAQDF